MKKFIALTFVVASLVSGCSYAGVATTGDGKAVVSRNDGLLFGLLRAVYVCQVTDGGLANCAKGEAP